MKEFILFLRGIIRISFIGLQELCEPQSVGEKVQARSCQAAFAWVAYDTSQGDGQPAPLDIVPGPWRRLVKPPPDPVPDRRAYTLCLLERLQDNL